VELTGLLLLSHVFLDSSHDALRGCILQLDSNYNAIIKYLRQLSPVEIELLRLLEHPSTDEVEPVHDSVDLWQQQGLLVALQLTAYKGRLSLEMTERVSKHAIE